MNYKTKVIGFEQKKSLDYFTKCILLFQDDS